MEELLNILGRRVVELIKKEMATPRSRFTKRGNMPKGTYNTIGTGSLRDSVDYRIVDEELIILMNDYGVEYVYSDLAESLTGGKGGSWPGGGRYYPDTRQAGQKANYSKLIESLIPWAQKKFQIPATEAKGVAFAVRKNLFKAGYAGIPLFTDQLIDNINRYVEELLQDERFVEVAAQDVYDKIESLRVFDEKTFNLAIG